MKAVHGGDIYRNPGCIDFSANLNLLSMPESVREAAVMGVKDSVHYPDVLCSKLARAIAQSEGVPEEWVLCGNGAADLIFMLCLALKPEKALLPAPTFAEYGQALACVGCEIEYYDLGEENGFQIGEDVLQRLKPDVDLFFLCSPNNPTGMLIDPQLLERIAAQCGKNKIWLVSDECFLDFLEDGDRYSARKYLSDGAEIFILKAFTKLYAMPGLRLGYGICADSSLLGRMRKCSQPWNVSVPAQYAGIAALLETDYVRRTRELLGREKAYLLRELSGLADAVYGSAANYIFFRAGETLSEDLKRKGILIRDCSNYRGLKKGYCRIAVRTHEENETLIKAWKELKTEQFRLV